MLVKQCLVDGKSEFSGVSEIVAEHIGDDVVLYV